MVPLIGIAGCGEKTPPPQKAKSVAKKIPIHGNASTPVPQAEKGGLGQGGVVASQPEAKDMGAPSAGAGAVPLDANATSASDLVQASLKIASSYDPKGRFDPFEPLFKEKPEPSPGPTPPDDGHVKGHLETIALSQLKVTAIIRAPSGNRALVADATGKGYVVRKGDYIGLNSGRIIAIEKDRIVIEEQVENLLGELTIKNAELKLQKPAGEL